MTPICDYVFLPGMFFGSFEPTDVEYVGDITAFSTSYKQPKNAQHLYKEEVQKKHCDSVNELLYVADGQSLLWRRLWRKGYRNKKVGTVIRVQILNEAICISHRTNTLRKDMNLTVLSQAMGK